MTAVSTLIRGLFADVQREVRRVAPFRATATAAATGKVSIQRPAAATADGETYARLDGFDIDDDAALICWQVSGKPVCAQVISGTPGEATLKRAQIIWSESSLAFRVVDSGGVHHLVVDTTNNEIEGRNGVDLVLYSGNGTGEVARIDGATGAITTVGRFLTSVDDGAALLVRTAGASTRFAVDTLANQVELWNGMDLKTYSDNGTTNTATIDAATGSAVFNGGVNSPIFRTESASLSATASTTSTSVYATAFSYSLVLPNGTWTVKVMGGLRLRHSAGGTVNLRTSIGGTEGNALAVAVGSAEYHMVHASQFAAGKSGTIDVRVEFKGSTAGTTESGNPNLVIWAERES